MAEVVHTGMIIISIPEGLASETYPACLHQHLWSPALIYPQDKTKVTCKPPIYKCIHSNSPSLLWKCQKCMHWVFLSRGILTSHLLLFVSGQARDLWRRILTAGVLLSPKGYSLKRIKYNLNVCAFFIEEPFISLYFLFLTNSCHSIISLSNQLFSTHTHSTDIVIAGYWANMEKR